MNKKVNTTLEEFDRLAEEQLVRSSDMNNFEVTVDMSPEQLDMLHKAYIDDFLEKGIKYTLKRR